MRHAKELRILIVEDNPGDRDLIQDLLAFTPMGASCRFLTAERLMEAIGVVQRNAIDVVLLDLGLPDSNGIATITGFRSRCSQVPVVVLTGNDDEQVGIAALQAGAQDYLVKGRYDGNELLRIIRYAVQRYDHERALMASEEKFREMVENIGMGVFLLGPDMRVLEMNRSMRQWFPEADVTDHPFCFTRFNGTPRCEPCDDCPVQEVLNHGLVAEQIIEKRFGAKGNLCSYRVIASPLRESEGQISGAIVMVDDITDRLLLERKLKQSQKMEAIGQLAGGIAHDFNNILQAMMGYSNLLLETIPGTSACCHELKAYTQEILQGTERASTLTRQLLAFSRRQILKLEDLDINEAIDSIMKMISRLISENIKLTFHKGRVQESIYADRGQIEQVIMNLCVNARDALPMGGQITIHTSHTDIVSVDETDGQPLLPGRYAVITVQDDGMGISHEHLEHIFEPFFTTKQADKGTGLGLSTVYGIVNQHHGRIQVTSEPGEGTEFRILLPVSTHHVHAAKRSEEPQKATGGQEMIMIAEDNEMVRRLAVRVLKQAGYSIVEAKNGDEAIEAFTRDPGSFDLLLLDVIMPGKSGFEVYEEVRKLRADVRALFSSGYSSDAIHTDYVLNPDIQLIEKPYSPNSLLARIRQILDTPLDQRKGTEAV